MAKTPRANADNAYTPLPRDEGESLFKHTFDNLRENALNAGENIYDPRTSAFVSFVTSDSFLTNYVLQGGDANDAVQFGLIGHEKKLEMADLGIDPTSFDTFANDIYAALDDNNESNINDLIIQSVETLVVEKQPEVAETATATVEIIEPLYSQEQTNTFWNAYTNINASIADNNDPKVYDYNRELLTYIQSDERYIAFHDAYLAHNTELSANDKESLRAEATIAHENSVRVLDETNGFSTDLFGASQDFYAAIEQNFAPVSPDTPVIVASIDPAPIALASVFDATVATRILGEELTQAPEVPMVTITMPSAPDILPEQIDVSAFNAEKLEERAIAEQEVSTLAAVAENSDTLPNADVSTPTNISLNTVTNISDASILLDGEASNDMDYLADLVQEAKAAGVDADLITSVETQIESKDFVTTQAATQGVQSYADALKAALENDGVLTRSEYNGALTNLFGAVSSGMVVDRAGMADDIAAAPGMEIQAQESLRRIFDMQAEGLVAANLPEAPTMRPAARPLELGLTG